MRKLSGNQLQVYCAGKTKRPTINQKSKAQFIDSLLDAKLAYNQVVKLPEAIKFGTWSFFTHKQAIIKNSMATQLIWRFEDGIDGIVCEAGLNCINIDGIVCEARVHSRWISADSEGELNIFNPFKLKIMEIAFFRNRPVYVSTLQCVVDS